MIAIKQEKNCLSQIMDDNCVKWGTQKLAQLMLWKFVANKIIEEVSMHDAGYSLLFVKF